MTLTAIQSVEGWLCYICGKPIPEHEGVLHFWLGIRAHAEACSDVVENAYCVIDKEENGPPARRKILKRICEVRSMK